MTAPKVTVEQKRAGLGPLLTTRRAGLPVSEDQIRAVAAELRCSRSTVYRWIAQGDVREHPRTAAVATDKEIAFYYACAGNAALAESELRGADLARSYTTRTYQRMFKRLSEAVKVDAKHGYQAGKAVALKLIWEPPHRNAVWEIDHVELSVEVRFPKHKHLVKVWMTVIIDGFSRAILGWAINRTQTQSDVIAALHEAMRTKADGNPLSGKPLVMVTDRGKEFLAKSVRTVAVTLDIHHRVLAAYHPWRKGKIEAWNGALETFLASVPGYTHGAKNAKKKPYTSPLTLELNELVGLVADWVRDYNTERRHSTIRTTPLRKWALDPTPIVELTDAEIRWMMMPAERPRKVDPRGIYHNYNWYQAEQLHQKSYEGRVLTMRYMPYDDRAIDVYDEDRFVCRAVLSKALTDEERADMRRAAHDQDAQRQAHRRRSKVVQKLRFASITEPRRDMTVTTPADAIRADDEEAGSPRLRVLKGGPSEAPAIDVITLDDPAATETLTGTPARPTRRCATAPSAVAAPPPEPEDSISILNLADL